MSAKTVKYGFKGKLYLNGGTYNSPVWNELSAVKDVKSNFQLSEVEATLRAGGGAEQAEPVLHKPQVTGMILSDETDTNGYLALEVATLGKHALDVMALNGPSTTNGARGVRFTAKNFNWNESQANGEILYREFDLRPCASTDEVQYVVVSGGAPTFTPLSSL